MMSRLLLASLLVILTGQELGSLVQGLHHEYQGLNHGYSGWNHGYQGSNHGFLIKQATDDQPEDEHMDYQNVSQTRQVESLRKGLKEIDIFSLFTCGTQVL